MSEQTITVETVRAYVGGEPLGTVTDVDDTDRVQALIRGGFLVEVEPELVATRPDEPQPLELPDDDAPRDQWVDFAARAELDVPNRAGKADYIAAVKHAFAEKRLDGNIVGETGADTDGDQSPADA